MAVSEDPHRNELKIVKLDQPLKQKVRGFPGDFPMGRWIHLRWPSTARR